MKGVLVVAHGSRAKETENTLKIIVDMLKESMPDICIEYAFMEFSDRTIMSGVDELARKNITEIKIVPYFLFTGIHIKEDIPNMVKECMKKYPDIKMVMGNPLGADKRLAGILADRIRD